MICRNQVRQEQNICIQNIRRLGQATLMYAEDFDQAMPLSTSNVGGRWQSQSQHIVPAGWSSSVDDPVVVGSKFVWPNTVLPYGVGIDALKCPSQQAIKVNKPYFTYLSPIKPPAMVGYTFNGLLNSYNQSQIVNPSRVPLIWEGRGRTGMLGGVLQTPLMNCYDATQPCRYTTNCSGSVNGSTGGLMPLDGAIWTHSRTNIWLFVDGHVEYRALGAVLNNSNTDSNVDPYTGYSERGIPGFIWTNGCHPLLFRPDY
jgi:prepilin-type processing-associated H-X9-DG protein